MRMFWKGVILMFGRLTLVLAMMSFAAACDDKPKNYSECMLKRAQSSTTLTTAQMIGEACSTLFMVTNLSVQVGATRMTRRPDGSARLEIEFVNSYTDVQLSSADIGISYKNNAAESDYFGGGVVPVPLGLGPTERMHQSVELPAIVATGPNQQSVDSGQYRWTYRVVAVRGVRVR